MVNIRSQMVKGSEWVAVHNFKFTDLKKSKFAPPVEMNEEMTNWQERYNIKNRPAINPVMVDVPAGTAIKILDKSTTYADDHLMGVFVPVSINDNNYLITLSELSPNISLSKGVEQSVFVLFSPSKNQYVKSRGYDWKIEWADTLGKAMKKKRSQDAKQFLLEISGYYKDIDTSSMYYVFEPGKQAVEYPADLMVIELDKITKEKKSEYLAQSYIDASMRLKPLTQRYGSSVRSLYKDIEKTGGFECMLLFKGDVYELKEVRDAFKALKYERGTYKMKQDATSVAIALADVGVGMELMFTLSNNLTPQLVDTETLLEITKK